MHYYQDRQILATQPNSQLRQVFNPTRHPSSYLNLFSRQFDDNAANNYEKRYSTKKKFQQRSQIEMKTNIAEKMSHHRYNYIVQKLNKPKKLNCEFKYCSCKITRLSFQYNNRSGIRKFASKNKSLKRYPIFNEDSNKDMKEEMLILSQRKPKKYNPKFNEQPNFLSFGNKNNPQHQTRNQNFCQEVQCTFNPKIYRHKDLKKLKQEIKQKNSLYKFERNTERSLDTFDRQQYPAKIQTQYESSSRQFSMINQLSPPIKEKQPIKNQCRSSSKLSFFSNIFKTGQKIKTIFAISNQAVKNEKSVIQLNNSYLNNQGIFTKLPQPNQYGIFLKKYQPMNQNFDIKRLVKAQSFAIINNNNNVYFGQVQNGLKNGLGLLIGNKQILEGTFENDQFISGYQKINQGVYHGTFINGKRSGKGVFQWKNGERFEGQWKEGKKHGNGIWTSPDGSSYAGQWHLNKQQGFGVFKHKKSVYKGTFKNFFKDGKGQEKFTNGDCYIGQYAKGKPHGEGIYLWKQGHSYEGFFVEGFREGYGRFIDSQGNIYMGNFYRDEKSGQGKQLYKSGEIFIGIFKKGIKSSGKLYGKDESQICIAQ